MSNFLVSLSEVSTFATGVAGHICDAQHAPQPSRRVHESPVLDALSGPSQLRVGLAREPAHRRSQRPDVLELMPNPASHVIRYDYLLDRSRSLLSLRRTHL